MRYLFGAFLLIHSFGHVAVFLAYWNVLKFEEISAKTELFYGSFKMRKDVMRSLGLLWALVGLGIAFMGIRLMLGMGYYIPLQALAIVSLLLTISGLPDTKVGFLLNLFMVPVVFMGWLFEWF